MKTKTCIAGILLAAALADAETVTRQHLVLASNAPVVLTATATNDLNSALQRGLFEEEGNRDLTAAISAYQSLAAQFDQGRQVAATAMFRLGECYRKLGRTNEAVAQYGRIVREFSDQPTLVTLSRQNLTGLGIHPSAASSTKNADAELLGKLKELPVSELEQVLPTLVPDNILTTLLQDRNIARQDRIKLERVRADNHPDIQNQDAQIKALDRRISERINGIMLAMQIRAGVLPASDSTATPMAASDDEDKEIRRLQMMIQNSPDLINALAGGNGGEMQSPLGHAASRDQLRVARFLLDHGAEVNRRSEYGRPPLFVAAEGGHNAMVELLLNAGADTNARRGEYKNYAGPKPLTALDCAVSRNFPAVVETLLAHKADPNIPGADGVTPLQRATQQSNQRIVELLLKHGATPNAKN